ncbi:MAG: SDR family oxidoreductase [Actinomycetota bacterium]|nr:SDR family oxidoreductase [Actinomycetota bacterium]
MNASEFLVTGGTGSLGSRVVDRLRAAGRDVRVLSREVRPGVVRGDLLTGEGLEQAVDGVDAVVHCASSPRKTRQTDVEGTERLLRAAGQAGVSHFVFISIVGVDRNPYFPYYRMKLEVERTIERSPVPWTILRATQFHEFVLRLIRFLERLPILMVPKGLLQPIDVGEVGDRLAELALSEPVGRAPDIGGPEIRSAAELARAYFEVAGRRRGVVEVPLPGKTARAFREGAQLCPEGRYGRIRFEEFLRQTIHPTKD